MLKPPTKSSCVITSRHCVGARTDGREVACCLLDRGQKSSHFHQRGQRKRFRNPQKPSSHITAELQMAEKEQQPKCRHGMRLLRTGAMLGAASGPTRDRDGVANSLRRRQDLHSRPSSERRLGPHQPLQPHLPNILLFTKSHFNERHHWQNPIISRDNFNMNSDSPMVNTYPLYTQENLP